MSILKHSITILLVLAALCSHTVFAHTYLSAVYLDNKLLSQGDCVRAHPATAFDSPIPLVTSQDMTCGWLPEANRPANRKCPISAGSTIGIQWHHNSNSPSDDIIDSTHKGPVMVYMAKSESGSGNVWFKIYEDGLVGGRWGVDRLLDNKGRIDVTIPADIAPGNYLLRGEIIALHSAYSLNGVQPYVGCVELTVSGSGSANPAGVAIPGYYTNTDPGMYLSIYQGITSYVIPGPAVYKAGSSGSSTGTPTTRPTTAPTSTPTTRPTSAPTTAPTTRPTSAPTNPPSSGSSVKVQVNSGANVWWFAVDVSGGSENTVKAELMDSGAISNFQIMVKASYGFYFSQSVQLTLPISLRLTSASGKQVVLEDFITSFSDFSVKNTNQDYATSVTPAPTSKATPAPTTRPTPAPTNRPTPVPTTRPTTTPTTRPTTAPTNPPSSGSSVKFQQHSGNSAWWFAVAVSGVDSSKIAKVELKDAGSYSSYSTLQSTSWGYYQFSSNGRALTAPITLRVTSTSGSTATATFSNFVGDSVAYSNAAL